MQTYYKVGGKRKSVKRTGKRFTLDMRKELDSLLDGEDFEESDTIGCSLKTEIPIGTETQPTSPSNIPSTLSTNIPPIKTPIIPLVSTPCTTLSNPPAQDSTPPTPPISVPPTNITPTTVEQGISKPITAPESRNQPITSQNISPAVNQFVRLESLPSSQPTPPISIGGTTTVNAQPQETTPSNQPTAEPKSLQQETMPTASPPRKLVYSRSQNKLSLPNTLSVDGNGRSSNPIPVDVNYGIGKQENQNRSGMKT